MANRGRPAKEFKGATAPLKNTATIEEVIEEAPAEAPKVSERQFIATNRRETQRLYPEGKVFTTSEIVALGHHPLMLVHRGIIRQL